jgi:hypothetical protein
MKHWLWSLAAVLLLAGCVKPDRERVWGCILHGTNGEGVTDPRVAGYQTLLTKSFGYKRFTILGSAWGGENVKTPHWVQPTKELFLKIEPAPGAKARNTYQIEVYQHTNQLLRTVATLPADKPLLIAGQNYAKGKLIVLVEVKKL